MRCVRRLRYNGKRASLPTRGVCVTLLASLTKTYCRRVRGPSVMKILIHVCAAALSAGTLFAVGTLAFAQNSPGVPGGILNDQFRLQEHPQLQFAASAPTKKYPRGTSKLRKKGDLGDPNGCNLQCPEDAE